MAKKYKRIEDKVKGVIPVEGMGATIHVDKYKVPCTIVDVGTTDRRAPMVGVQVDKTGKGEFIRDAEGTLMLFTYRKTDEWRQYGYGFKSGARLELGIRRCKSFTVADDLGDAVRSPDADTDAVEACGPHADAVPNAVEGCGPHADAVPDAVSTAERLRRRLAERDLK